MRLNARDLWTKNQQQPISSNLFHDNETNNAKLPMDAIYSFGIEVEIFFLISQKKKKGGKTNNS